ncbi:PepSY domain-containing protein [uncultured Jannaschia sp.]|uniref:PepSY domain-containing protein n=1 Tax=uncultured Jannaschia sp. TaxID=293347 RepID=UPI00260546A1|nr:PepSY domain-containing protein [uncultured Jannaschia sp.]
MNRLLVASALSLALAGPVLAQDEVSEEVVATITEVLADTNCQMDPDDIEVTETEGYELDDVICEGGQQYDIELDQAFNEVSRRAE